MDLAEPNFVSSLLRVRPRGVWHKLTPPAIYEPQYRIESIESDRTQSTHWERFKKIRDENDLVIFHHSRHHWRAMPGQPDWILKGNDQILQGLKLFKDNNPNLSFKLVTFEYGPDVAASKALAEHLGIQDNIEWLPVLPRRELRIGLAFSDVGVGEIHKSWYSYGVMLEVLAVGLPFIGRREGELASRPNSYPMASVTSGSEFATALQEFRSHTPEWKAMGRASNSWLRHQMDEVVTILAAITDAA
jgi:glycosyltransferase involved in cell wall biosynthesis